MYFFCDDNSGDDTGNTIKTRITTKQKKSWMAK